MLFHNIGCHALQCVCALAALTCSIMQYTVHLLLMAKIVHHLEMYEPCIVYNWINHRPSGATCKYIGVDGCIWICFISNLPTSTVAHIQPTTLHVWSWSGPCCWLIEFHVTGHDSSIENKTSRLFGGLEVPRSAKIWQLGVVGSMPWVISLLGFAGVGQKRYHTG